MNNDKAPTDRELLAAIDQRLADRAAALLASLPPRRVRKRTAR